MIEIFYRDIILKDEGAEIIGKETDMKKVFKSISVLVLSLALAVSGLAFVQTAKADEVSEWQKNAVKTPTAGSLVGAGYIDVEFDNSLSGYTYEVLLDGKSVYWDENMKNILRPELGEDTSGGQVKTFRHSDIPKTEVYTTDVAAHQITVKATSPSNTTYTSNPVTFYVSKKGLAMGDNMGTKVKLSDLNCSWYYNWGTNAFKNSVDGDVPHIPMMWGGYDDSKEAMTNLSTSSNYILGFNEPDIESQANMKFWDAVDVWNEYIGPKNLRKVSPAPAAPGGNSGWLNYFMNGAYICHNTFLDDGSWGMYDVYQDEASKKWVGGKADDVDAVCLHYYMAYIDPEGLINAVNTLWETYHKPIWITEIGLFGRKGYAATDMSYELENKRVEIQNYLTTIVNALDGMDCVERYCWFPYDVDSTNDIDLFDGSGGTAMFEYATGLYTDLGRLYSSIGNPAGYSANTISSSKSFEWDNRVRTDVSYDATSDRVKVTWSAGALENLSKVKVLIDGNDYSINNGDEIDTSEFDQGKHSVEFTLYDDSNNEIIKKNRAFTINRSAVPTTTVVPATEAPTEKPTVAPEVKPTAAPTNESVAKLGQTKLKAKNVKKKSVKLSWSAVSNAKSYKVQWAMNKIFTKKAKSKIVTKLGLKIKKLKKKKTYFFRIAAMDSSSTGPWSNVKKIKIKK